MNRASVLPTLLVAWLASWAGAGCDQLGNPQQYATGPTPWKDRQGHLVTTTRSFKNEKAIRRIVSEDLEKLDYADPSIGPAEVLTVVMVAPQGIHPMYARRRQVDLVTIFKLQGRPPISRRWSAPTASRKWSAAFALPEPPLDAISSVVP